MTIEEACVLEHRKLSGSYRELRMAAPSIAAAVKPGQFVHLRVPGLNELVLRRPFSVFKSDGSAISLLYKPVGKGTQAMTAIVAGEEVSLIGPLGNGFPLDHGERIPVLIAGGYGVAPLCLLASRLEGKGIVFIGAETASDALCIDDFSALGWKVRIGTEDGSLGDKGLVTDVLDAWLQDRPEEAAPEFFACGPEGMLKEVAERAIDGGWKGWISLDKHMGCGVGVCLTCVQKIRNADGSEAWARVCRDGPVFEARDIVWDQSAAERKP